MSEWIKPVRISVKSVPNSARQEQKIPVITFDIGSVPSGLNRGTVNLRNLGLTVKTIYWDGGYTQSARDWYTLKAGKCFSAIAFQTVANNNIPDYRIEVPIETQHHENKHFLVSKVKHQNGQTIVTGGLCQDNTGSIDYTDQNSFEYLGGKTVINDSTGLTPYADYNVDKWALMIATDTSGEKYIGFSFLGFTERNNRLVIPTLYCWNDLSTEPLPEDEEDVRFGAESTEEGYPTDEPEGMFDFDSDQIDLDELPTESVSNSGYLNVYKVTPSALAGIMEEVNPKPTIIEPPSDIVDYPRYIGDQLGQLIDVYFSKGLANYIIDCHMIPCAVTGGTSTHIQVGAKTIINTAPKLTSDYVEVNLGSVNIPQCHYNFLDLATDIKLFLPFVSYVPLPPELVLGGTLSVSYRFNVLDGSFVATVKATSKFSNLSNSVIAQYSGCCCVHMPLASNDYANIVSGIVGTVGSVSRLDGRGAVIGALDTAQQLTTGGDFTLSNGYNASSSFLGHRTPYLIISRPVKSFSGAYPHENGLPCNVRHKLSDVHGYTECGNIHLDGFGCTAREKEMLSELLQNGIILP